MERAPEFPEGELRRLISEAARPPLDPHRSEVENEYEEVGLCVEAALSVPGHFVAVRGWLADPNDRTHSLWLEIDGALRRVGQFADSYRPDLIHLRRLGNVRPGLRAGFSIMEPWEADAGPGSAAYLHAVLRADGGPRILSGALAFQELGTRRLPHVLDEYGGGSWPPAALSRIARPVLRGVAAVRRGPDWQDHQLDVSGRTGAALSYLVAVDSNAEILGHLLGFIEMDPLAHEAEVIFVLRSPHLLAAVEERVRPWRGGSVIRAIAVLTPGNEVTFGSAIRAAVENSAGRVLAITTDELVPPEAGWIGRVLRALEGGSDVLLPSVQTFDGRPMDFSHSFDLAWHGLQHDHSGVGAALRTAMGNSARMPFGAIALTRDTALARGLLDDSYTSVDLCFADWYRREAAGTKADPGIVFTHNRLPANATEDPVERLWNLHALAAAAEGSAAASPAEAAVVDERGAEPGTASLSGPRAARRGVRQRR